MPNYLTSNTGKTVQDPVYTDIDPTMGAHPKTDDLLTLSDTKAVRQSILNLLSTAYGERLFEPIDSITTFEMRDRILNTLRTHEPRIGTLFVDIKSFPDQNSYEVSVEFSLRATGEKDTVNTVLERIR